MSNNRAHLSTPVEVQKVAPPSPRTRRPYNPPGPGIPSFLMYDRTGPPNPHPEVSTRFPLQGCASRARALVHPRACKRLVHAHTLTHIYTYKRRGEMFLGSVPSLSSSWRGKSIQGNQEAAAGRRQQPLCRLHPGTTTPTRRTLVARIPSPLHPVNPLMMPLFRSLFSLFLSLSLYPCLSLFNLIPRVLFVFTCRRSQYCSCCPQHNFHSRHQSLGVLMKSGDSLLAVADTKHSSGDNQ